MDVFHVDSNISSSLVDDGTSGTDDITEVHFDAHSEFNLIFFDTPDDSPTQGGFSNPDSVESIVSIAPSPPPPPSITSSLYQSAQQQCQSLLQNAQTTSSTNPTSINQQHQQQQHQLPQSLPILVKNIKNGKLASCLLVK